MSSKSILEMSSEEAKKFFLKPASYFNVKLPTYFDLEAILVDANKKLGKSGLSDIATSKIALKSSQDVNLTIMANKDAKYAWRNFKLIHPVVYVDIVNKLTCEENWQFLKNRFTEFQQDERIVCLSIPRESTGSKSDKATQIMHWWKNLEQAQVELALDFEYCIQSDVTDCYPSIYTHTIAWALHGKDWAKVHQMRSEGFGNELDHSIQALQEGQTNGIPQGSVVMDFIAEMVLSYADLELSLKVNELGISDFRVLRYRDDYRIFSNSLETAEQVMKLISEVLLDLNLKINSKKTFLCSDIIFDGIKADKIYWTITNASLYSTLVEYKVIRGDSSNSSETESPKLVKIKKKDYKLSLQKHLLQIKLLGEKYPNCGQLLKALNEYYQYRVYPLDSLKNQIDDSSQLVSILTSIMVKNPRTVELCAIIIAKLFEFMEESSIESRIDAILKKYRSVPNTDFVEIWLQRISIHVNRNKVFNSKLSQKVYDNGVTLWNSQWLKENKQIDESLLINNDMIDKLSLTTSLSEADEFADSRRY